MSGIAVRDMMNSAYGRIREDETILEAAQQMPTGRFALPIVSDGDRFQGIITAMDIVQEVAGQQDLSAARVGQRGAADAFVGPDQLLEDAARELERNFAPILPVVAQGKLVGVVTHADVSAFRYLSRLLGDRVGDLNTEIGEGDSMLEGVRGLYFLAMASALEVIQRSLESAGRTSVESILDFPCGWGRVLRVLKVAFPEASLTASDIDKRGVDYCASALGARPVYSVHDPADVDLGDTFDLIWVGSLFTHFPAHRWRGFLDLFARSLKPGGVLVFTTLQGNLTDTQFRSLINPAAIDDIRASYAADGYGFFAQVGKNLGLAVAAPGWVKEQIEEHPDLRLVRYDERAWQAPLPLHDVTTCVRA